MPPKSKPFPVMRDGDEVVEQLGPYAIVRSAGGGEYLTGPGLMSLDVHDEQLVNRAGRALPEAARQGLTTAVERARARWSGQPAPTPVAPVKPTPKKTSRGKS